MGTIIEAWDCIFGKDVLIETKVNIGDKIKFCDNTRFYIHVLEITGINCGGIEAKDFEANRIYLEREMLDIKVLSIDEYEKEKIKIKNMTYQDVIFELSDGFSIKL